MFKEKLLKFLKANGISEAPETKMTEFTMVDGYTPTEQWVWYKAGFVKLSLAMSVVPETEAGALGVLEELQKFFEVPVGASVAWNDLETAPSPNVPFKNPIGVRVPQELVDTQPHLDKSKAYFFNIADKLPEVGSKFSNGADEFVALSFGMFSRWWMKK